MKGLRSTVETLLTNKHREVTNVLRLLNSYRDHSNGNRSDVDSYCRQLESMDQEISKHEDSLNRVSARVELRKAFSSSLYDVR